MRTTTLLTAVPRIIQNFKSDNTNNDASNHSNSSREKRSRADKKPGVLRIPCKLVEAKSTVNYGMFDVMLYCPATWVHTSNLVLLPQLVRIFLQIYLYREVMQYVI